MLIFALLLITLGNFPNAILVLQSSQASFTVSKISMHRNIIAMQCTQNDQFPNYYIEITYNIYLKLYFVRRIT